MLRIIKRVITRCVICFAAMVAETELFWGGGLFNMIRWVICVIGIAVDNLDYCRIGTK